MVGKVSSTSGYKSLHEAPAREEGNGCATASFVSGLLGLVFLLAYLASHSPRNATLLALFYLADVTAFCLGFVGLLRVPLTGRGRGLAIVGLVLSSAAVVVTVVVIVLMVHSLNGLQRHG